MPQEEAGDDDPDWDGFSSDGKASGPDKAAEELNKPPGKKKKGGKKKKDKNDKDAGPDDSPRVEAGANEEASPGRKSVTAREKKKKKEPEPVAGDAEAQGSPGPSGD